MELTTQLLSRYKGGQTEIQKLSLKCLYRGEVRDLNVVESKLHIYFSWLAKGQGFPPLPKRWVRENLSDFEVDLKACVIGETGQGGCCRLCLRNPGAQEIIILCSPNDQLKLDLKRVQAI